MREIKFRAWNKEKKIMVYNNEDNSAEYWDGAYGSDIEIINTALTSFPLNTYEFLQYTGIKDKNGVEIYEGDIIEIEFMDHIVKGDKFKGIVKFYDGSFFVENEKSQNAHFLFREVDILTVLGNTYENVELLEGIIC